uniref:Eyes absent homolog n=1 Tax=Caenorhabditis tropicalis TaxID=1561998 RepID=A0A1I7UH05_9PELO
MFNSSTTSKSSNSLDYKYSKSTVAGSPATSSYPPQYSQSAPAGSAYPTYSSSSTTNQYSSSATPPFRIHPADIATMLF